MRPFLTRDFEVDKKQLIADGVFALAMLLTAVFVFWKCRYGFGNVDGFWKSIDCFVDLLKLF